MKPATRWIVAIVGLLAANVIATIFLATAANVGHSDVIPDYYNQAAHYDDVLAQGETNVRLGWRISVALVSGELSVTVRDAAGQPIDGATLTATSFPRSHAGERLETLLDARGPGTYRGAVDQRPGLHDVAITIEHAGAKFVQRAVVEAR